jgi:putative transposase
MPQSLSKLTVHLIYSTKNRYPFLSNPEVRSKIEAYPVGIFRELDCPSLLTKIMPDHVHTLFLLSRTRAIADVVKEVKKSSSGWIKGLAGEANDPMLPKFSWQSGYGAFSVSESNLQKVEAYIRNQEEHHRKVTFQEEYRLFLKRHNIPYDERYVWD